MSDTKTDLPSKKAGQKPGAPKQPKPVVNPESAPKIAVGILYGLVLIAIAIYIPAIIEYFDCYTLECVRDRGADARAIYKFDYLFGVAIWLNSLPPAMIETAGTIVSLASLFFVSKISSKLVWWSLGGLITFAALASVLVSHTVNIEATGKSFKESEYAGVLLNACIYKEPSLSECACSTGTSFADPSNDDQTNYENAVDCEQGILTSEVASMRNGIVLAFFGIILGILKVALGFSLRGLFAHFGVKRPEGDGANRSGDTGDQQGPDAREVTPEVESDP